MNDSERTTRDNTKATDGQRDASAGWKAEYWHQGVRFSDGSTPRGGDERTGTEGEGQVPISDYQQPRAGERDGNDVEGEVRS